MNAGDFFYMTKCGCGSVADATSVVASLTITGIAPRHTSSRTAITRGSRNAENLRRMGSERFFLLSRERD